MNKKQGMQGFRPKLISLAVASCFVTSSVLANPTNPVVKHGAANFTNPAANVLHVTTATPQTIINWGSFSISANELTKFLQPSAASAVLNRVVGGDPSAILGALQSNGRVLLVNPSGIIFGAGAQIDVAGLVATSLNLSNEDFLANRMRFAEVPGAGSVVNSGNITTPQGGNVYLVGPAVTNNGIITSPNGQVVLAAGNSVELVNPGTPNLRVEISAAENEARNIGQIVSESGRVGIYAGLINNAGTIRANSAVAEGGKILLKATKQVTLESTSILDASGNGGGTIEVLSKNGGTVNVAGRLDASAPNGGDGGFIETSADKFSFADGTVVTTAAPKGKTGNWLIDPTNIWIADSQGTAYGAGMIGTDASADSSAYGGATLVQASGGASDSFLSTGNLVAALDLNSVTVSTANAAAYGSGDINVVSPVTWSNGNSLTLLAHNNVNVNSAITNNSTGAIKLYAGWDGADPVNPSILPCCSGTINLLAPIKTGGTIVLAAGIGGVTQDVNGVITATNLLAGGSGSVLLDVADNMIVTLAGDTQGSFRFKNAQSLTVGGVDSGNTSIGGGTGIIAGVASTDAMDVTITVSSGNLSVNKNILAAGGNSNDAMITLVAQGALTVNDSTISAQGIAGEGGGNATVALTAQTGGITLTNSIVEAIADGGGCCGSTGTAAVSMDAAGGVTLTNSDIVVTGGSGSTPAGTASAALTAGGNIQLTGSSIQVSGGASGGSGSGAATGGQATVSANASSGSISMDSGSSINVAAGNAGTANLFSFGTAFADGGYAQANLSGANGITMSGTINATGGDGGGASAAYGGTAIAWGGSANVNLNGGSGAVNASGTISAVGGDGGSATSTGFAYAGGGSANVHVSMQGSGGVSTGSGLISAAGGTGGFATAVTSFADGGQAVVNMGTFGASGPVAIGAGGITATGGAGGSGGPRFGGFAGIFFDGAEGAPVGAVQIGGNLSVAGGAGTNGGDGGGANVNMSGTGINLSSGVTISATGGGNSGYGGAIGVANVGLFSSGNVTLGGDITTIGDSPLNPFPGDEGGIFISAGNAIIGAGGILSAVKAGTNDFPVIALNAVNGIGTIAAPVRIQDGSEATGPDIYLNNSSTGDIAVSFVSGNVEILNDLDGLLNSNPTGTYSINVENGSFLLATAFEPNLQPLAAGQHVLVTAPNGNVTLASSQLVGSIVTSGAGTITVQAGGTVTSDSGTQLTGSVVNVSGASIVSAGNVNGGAITATGTTGINITGGVSGNTITLAAPTITSAGALGAVNLINATATGALNITGGSLTAPAINLQGSSVTSNGALTGGPVNATATGGNISLAQAPSIVLGQLSSSGAVSVTSSGGAIVDGNAGLNVMSPSATLSAAAGVGSIANPLETQTGALAVTSSGGEIGIINSGDLTLGNVTFGGANAQIGTTGTMVATGALSAPAGNLALASNNGMVILNSVDVSGDLVLNSGAGDMGFDGASVSGNNVTLNGNNIFVGFTTSTAPTTVAASNLMKATSAGNLNVLGGANSGANALLEGNNVDLTVGTVSGFLNIAAGSNGATAQIHSISPTTINVFFPNLQSGGYFVNGVEGAVTDGSTGFFAGSGAPAVLSQNLVVTYGNALPPTGGLIEEEAIAGVDQVIGQIVASTNDQSDLTENVPGEVATVDPKEGDKDKKGLPLCN